jgi:hypothetical protein
LASQSATAVRHLSCGARLRPGAIRSGKTGFPFDVECAYENGWVYLLRCRAVTALDGMRDV